MFNGVFWGDSLPRIKDRVRVINLDDKQSKGTYWISLFIDRNTAVYFDSFGIEYIQDKLKINPSHAIHVAYKIMILLCADFIVLPS